MEEHEQDTQTVVIEDPTPITQEPHWSNKIRQEHERYGFLILEEGDVLLLDEDEPITYQEVINCNTLFSQ